MYLETFRKYLGYSQGKLAEKLGIAQTTIARYETNKVKPTTDLIMKYIEKVDANPLFLFIGKGHYLLSDVSSFELNAKNFSSSNGEAIKSQLEEEEDPDSIHNKLKKIRIALGLTQEEFAKKIGFNQARIARYEKDREPDCETLHAIVKTYGVDANWLIGDFDVPMFLQWKEDNIIK